MRFLALLALPLLLVPAVEAQQTGPALTPLLFHPYPDSGGDPFGFEYSAGRDAFAARYTGLIADDGRFDYPYFIADGVIPIEQVPDPNQPFASTLAAYRSAILDRADLEPPAAIILDAVVAGDGVGVSVAIDPIADPGPGLVLHVALAEDPVHFEPPPAFSNGVTEHRFTVRAFASLGVQDLSAPSQTQHVFTLRPTWDADRLVVAAWLQAGAEPLARFAAREVVQATHVAVGEGPVIQESKGVLAEMLSATWCEPCLYGDLALEDLAISMGGATPLPGETGPRYFQGPASWLLGLAAACGGALILASARFR